MSKFIKINLLIIAAGLVLVPQFAKAKTLVLDKASWELPEAASTHTSSYSVRNSFSLQDLTAAVILNNRANNLSVELLNASVLAEVEEIQTQVNQEAKSARMEIEGSYAKNFEPGQDGKTIDVYQLYNILTGNNPTSTLPVVTSSPKTRLSDTNDLGITELIASGESNYTGSPYNRVVNIKVGASKFDGIVVKPGEEFSFNKFLGDVDAANGFLPELVIKREGLVPEFGGGLCQVSSTVFRAAMNAGLPITERRNHSFAVQYYGPQGTDATIYPGVVDFKFRNNLNSHLVMKPRIEGTKLYFDFYGTKDSRVVQFEGPTQYDKQPSGAMKAVWSRKVTINNETTEQTFHSNYVSPALYQRVSTVQATTQNPQSEPVTPPASTETEAPAAE